MKKYWLNQDHNSPTRYAIKYGKSGDPVIIIREGDDPWLVRGRHGTFPVPKSKLTDIDPEEKPIEGKPPEAVKIETEIIQQRIPTKKTTSKKKPDSNNSQTLF